MREKDLSVLGLVVDELIEEERPAVLDDEDTVALGKLMIEVINVSSILKGQKFRGVKDLFQDDVEVSIKRH